MSSPPTPTTDDDLPTPGNGSHEGLRDIKDKRINRISTSRSASEDQASLIGDGPVMRNLKDLLRRVADSESTVLITGATGTGKELVAKAIHQHSRRACAPFVDINCSALPDTLIETELFGHQRGTFTGALESRCGLFEVASNGTLFLDEVDALSPAAQAKLLRVLQQRQVRRIGARQNIPVDVRIISATNCELKKAVARGEFRADLYYRLRVVPVHAPDLRDHKEDIPALTLFFLQRLAQRRTNTPRRLSTEALQALLAYDWPGNVRELENAIEYACAISRSEDLSLADLPPDIVKSNSEDCNVLKDCLQRDATLADAERHYILWMFERCGRHHVKTASVLGVDRRTLYRRLQQYGVTSFDIERGITASL